VAVYESQVDTVERGGEFLKLSMKGLPLSFKKWRQTKIEGMPMFPKREWPEKTAHATT